MFGITRIRNDRIHGNVREVPGLIGPGGRGAAGIANNAIDMAGRERGVRVETAYRSISNRRIGRRWIESNVEDRTIR